MKSLLFLSVITTLTVTSNGLLGIIKKPQNLTGDNRVWANVKIYSNLAEVTTPLGKLPLEFSTEDWNDIRSDSFTLVGAGVNVLQQTITEKKKSLNNAQIHVRSPTSSDKEVKYVKATLIDEKRNLVKLTDKDISKDPVYMTSLYSNVAYDEEEPQTKYYVNFTYETTDAVSVSYLRSNLNWKTRYQLNVFDEPKVPILVAIADIRNDGQSKIDIEDAELLGGDINLQVSESSDGSHKYNQPYISYAASPSGAGGPSADSNAVTVGQGEEVAGLYSFAIKQSFSIEPKTNYILQMFRPKVAVERFTTISKYFYSNTGSSIGKAQRTYRLSSDRFLPRGNCIIRELDRLVGETLLPNLAAKDKHEFSVGQDADIVYKENVTVVSTRPFNETIRRGSFPQERTETVYNVNVLIKNYKKNRAVKVEYQQHVVGHSVKLFKPNPSFTQDGSKIKSELTVPADSEKLLTYKFELIN